MGRSVDRHWLPLNALRAFEGVARHGGFTAAANALFTSQSSLSRHVIALEEALGHQLFVRRPNSLELTKAGQFLFHSVTRSMDLLVNACNDLCKDGGLPMRTLRVQMSPSFAVQLAVPILRDFKAVSGGIDIDVTSPYVVGLPLGDVDIAVVFSKPSVTELVSDLLWSVHETLLCHPAVAARHAGKDLASFIAANEIVHVRIGGLPRYHSWSQFAHQNGLASVNVERGLVFDTAVLAVQYALSGQGIALSDPRLFAEEIRAGRLVRPFEAQMDDGYGYYLTTQAESLGDAAVALFRSWLIERFGTEEDHSKRVVQLAVANR
jgi:DNA-binding transcriptional LysR family regulator